MRLGLRLLLSDELQHFLFQRQLRSDASQQRESATSSMVAEGRGLSRRSLQAATAIDASTFCEARALSATAPAARLIGHWKHHLRQVRRGRFCFLASQPHFPAKSPRFESRRQQPLLSDSSPPSVPRQHRQNGQPTPSVPATQPVCLPTAWISSIEG